MKSDARLLINKKKWKKQNFSPVQDTGRGRSIRSAIDARKILNLKRTGKVLSKLETNRGSRKMNSSDIPFVKKTFSSQKVPNKHVKLSSDGNIWITAKSKPQSTANKSSPRTTKFGMSSSKNQLKWTPADIDVDDIEHIGIDDLIDMESLPPAVVSTSVKHQSRPAFTSHRSLADEVLDMQNTMVADQIVNSSSYQSARVFVSNLRSSVSKQDIMELFGDVGLVKSVEMPQLGMAVIEYFDIADASRACGTYHSRLLDGQPMKCYLQPSASASRPSISERLGGRVQSFSAVQPSATFSPNPRSRYNPRDVRFTVKLT